MTLRRWGLAELLLAGTCALLRAEPPAPAAARGGVGADPPRVESQDAAALAARIDRLIAARLAADNVPPAPQADDAEFLRRVYLDLTGQVPSVAQVRRFLRDRAPDKRPRLIGELLESGPYVRHFTNVWRAVLTPETNAENAGARAGLEAWLRQQLAANTAYDELVRGLLRPGGPRSFYLVNQNKPENLAAATARLFLGVKLECAQCHRHPFARWTREQFWGLAAFFAGVPQPGQRGAKTPAAGGARIKIPGTEKVVQARFLNDREPPLTAGADPRQVLADWVTAPDNPFFARAAVNRLWAHFFGIGLVDPVDDLGEQNPASHPELLEELARQFAAHRYDLKFLARAITLSETYQRTSRATHPGQDDARRFARMAVKGMSAEQIFDSLARATGYRESGPAGGGGRAAFLAKFTNPAGKPTEFQLSILQALSLMNGKLVADVTDLERSETLAAVLDAPFLDTAGRVETLYLAALGRPPRPEEAARLLKYVEGGVSDGSPRRALADVFWALLNSGEFVLNH